MSSRLSLLDHFSGLEDPRRRVISPLPAILWLVLCTTLRGMDDFVEMRVGRAAPGHPTPHPPV